MALELASAVLLRTSAIDVLLCVAVTRLKRSLKRGIWMAESAKMELKIGILVKKWP